MKEKLITLSKNLLTVLCTIFFIFIAFNTSIFAADSDIVYIKDAEFKTVLNKQLGVSDKSADITEGQLKSITVLYVNYYDIKDISGIEYCVNLKEVSFNNCSSLTNISSLVELPNLEKISISLCKNISDFTCISKLSNIETLELCAVKLTDISFLSELTNLKHLDLRDNYLTNINTLKQLKSLQTLNISNNEIVDISALGSLTNLTVLIMNSNYIKDINSIKNLTKLCELNLSWNKSIEDISVLKNLTIMESLNISQINVTDIFPIYGLQNLKHLEMDNIRINDENKDAYVSTLSSLVNLEYLSVENCGIPDEYTNMFTCMKNLKTLNLDFNKVSDFSFLSKLPKLDFEYRNNDPINFLIDEEIKLSISATECKIINKVKDVNGNYVIPQVKIIDASYLEAGTSSIYRYDSDFNEIIIDFSELDNLSQIKFNYNFTNNLNGCSFEISNTKIIHINYFEPFEVELTYYGASNDNKWFVGDRITLQTHITNGSGRFDYKYYMINHSKDETIVISRYNYTGSYECLLNPTLYGDISFYAEIIDNDDNGRLVKTNTVTINVQKNGWRFKDNNWYYYNYNGEKVTGWKKVSNKWYYFDENSIMQSSKWIKTGTKWYYLDKKGVMQVNKWINNKYYVKSNGAMAVSEFVDNGRYYVDENGAWVNSTKWLKLDNNWYYIYNGTVQISKWMKISNKWYYFDANGIMQAAKWVKISGYWYYFDANGVMQASKWINGKYYVKADGRMAVSEWVDNNKYYVDENGVWVSNP